MRHGFGSATLGQMVAIDPDWTAPRRGHDWRDDDVLRAAEWLKSYVPTRDMERRLELARSTLEAARTAMREGTTAPMFDPADMATWYVLQAEAFASDRRFWVPEAAARVVPVFTRLGKELDRLLTVGGVDERAARLMLSERRQPDSGLFELLVALAYRRGGWTRVEFVPETPGLGRTPDLHVFRSCSRWAVECKRLMPSLYAEREKRRGEALAAPLHALALEFGESLVIDVIYKMELNDVPDDYLIAPVRQRIERRSLDPWEDEIAIGSVRSVSWPLALKVLRDDDVYYGSSRMIELLCGRHFNHVDYSMAAKWRPARERPAYAEAVYQASVVGWQCVAGGSARQKARHFRSTLARAESQLPPDRPGVIHIGVESRAGSEIDSARHIRNLLEARWFEPGKSRLRWVYGNYFVPEVTTRQHESWAMTETMSPYKVGRHDTRWPLPDHMLLTPEDEARSGVHWDP